MRKLLATSALLALPLIASHPVHAQDSRVHWDVMGGYSGTLGNTANYLQGGFVLDVGLGLTPIPGSPLDLRFDLSWAQHYATVSYLNSAQQSLGTQIDYGYGDVAAASAHVLYHFPVARGVRAYGIAGIGAYYTRIELDQALPFYGFSCDFYYCYDYGYSEAQVAAHGVTNFGWDAGIGVDFDAGYGRQWFIEARYQRVNSSATVEYLPIEVGVRF
jgi:hypothetical protein